MKLYNSYYRFKWDGYSLKIILNNCVAGTFHKRIEFLYFFNKHSDFRLIIIVSIINYLNTISLRTHIQSDL